SNGSDQPTKALGCRLLGRKCVRWIEYGKIVGCPFTEMLPAPECFFHSFLHRVRRGRLVIFDDEMVERLVTCLMRVVDDLNRFFLSYQFLLGFGIRLLQRAEHSAPRGTQRDKDQIVLTAA